MCSRGLTRAAARRSSRDDALRYSSQETTSATIAAIAERATEIVSKRSLGSVLDASMTVPASQRIHGGFRGASFVPIMNQTRLQGVQSKMGHAVAAAIKIIESGRYPLEKIMTKVYALDDAHEALLRWAARSRVQAHQGGDRPKDVASSCTLSG